MSKMVYRPQTDSKGIDGLTVFKTKVGKLAFDALVVSEEQAVEYLTQGWFSHPDDMKATNDNRKRNNKRSTKAS